MIGSHEFGWTMEARTRRILAAALLSLGIHLSGGWFVLQLIKAMPVIRPPQPLEISLIAPAPSPGPSLAPKTRAPRPRPVPKPLIPIPSPVPEPPTPSSEIEKKAETTESPVPPSSVPSDGPKESRPQTDSEKGRESTREMLPETHPAFDADYLKNPIPEYPPMALRLGLQGTVIVRVLVDPDGRPDRVLLEKSSGAQILDDAALRAVERWLFVPARRGDQSVPAWVDVPVRFRLN